MISNCQYLLCVLVWPAPQTGEQLGGMEEMKGSNDCLTSHFTQQDVRQDELEGREGAERKK